MTDDEFKIALACLPLEPGLYEQKCYNLSIEYVSVLDSVRARATYLNAMLQCCRDMEDVRGYRAIQSIRKLVLDS